MSDSELFISNIHIGLSGTILSIQLIRNLFFLLTLSLLTNHSTLDY